MLAPSDIRPVNPTSLRADRVRLACGQAIVLLLREAGRPLPVLDLLDDLGRHYRGWTSSTVRHTLADLAERGVVAVRRDQRPCGYALGDGQTTARPD